MTSPAEEQAQNKESILECSDFLQSAGLAQRVPEEHSTSDGRIRMGDGGDAIFSYSKTKFFEQVVEKRADSLGPYSVVGIEYPSIDGIQFDNILESEKVPIVEFLTDFVSLELMDSISLDNPKLIEEWFDQEAEKYLEDSLLKRMESETKKTFRFQSIDPSKPRLPVFTDPFLFASGKGFVLPMSRDGGPRVFNKKLQIQSVYRSGGDIAIFVAASAVVATDIAVYKAAEFEEQDRLVIFDTDDLAKRQRFDWVRVELAGNLRVINSDSIKFTDISFLNFGTFFTDSEPSYEELANWRNELRICQ